MQATASSAPCPEVPRLLTSVSCPMHAIYGREDALYFQRQKALAPALHAAPNFRGMHWVEGVSHWTQFEPAEAFNRPRLALPDEMP